MTGWILSIVGMVLTVTLTEIMLPEGQTSKYIKGVISLMVVYVVIIPLPHLLNASIDVNSFFDFSADRYQTDAAFIQIIKEDKQSALAEEINRAFAERGLMASVELVLAEDYTVAQVFLTATTEDMSEARRLTIRSLAVKEEKIVINEVST